MYKGALGPINVRFHERQEALVCGCDPGFPHKHVRCCFSLCNGEHNGDETAHGWCIGCIYLCASQPKAAFFFYSVVQMRFELNKYSECVAFGFV